MEIWNNITSNPYAWLFGVAISIISVILAYKYVPSKIIKYSLKHIELIENKQSEISKLNILYDNKQVEKLAVTRVTFWNSSYPTIKNEDLVEKAPFSITLGDGNILDVVIDEGKDGHNQINSEPIDEHSIKIIFDYLDREEGGIIYIIHTGEENSVSISGKIKGGKIVTVPNERKRVLMSIALFLLGFTVPFLISFLLIIFVPNANLIYITPVAVSIAYPIIIKYQNVIVNNEFTPKNCRSKIRHDKE